MRRVNVLALATAIFTFLALLPMADQVQAQEIVDQPFEDETWTEGLVDLRSIDITRTHLVDRGFAGGGLAVTIPEGGYRGLGPFNRLDPAPEEAWFRYFVRLTDWNAASTGKLPGFAGIYSSSARGCIRPTASSPGWSARGMFGAPGTNGAPPGEIPVGTYLYHENQAGSCGDGLWWQGASLEQGRWHCIEGHVKMNTPGQDDGGIHGWLDGELKLNKWNIQFRRAGEDQIGVRHMWHNVYFGGTWPTPNRLALLYDEVVVSTTGRIGCMRPFTDVGQSIHAEAVEEMHALGYLYGCAYRQACPGRELSRGEAAAFISRVLDLPPSPRDYFSDDSGTFEDVINRLAHAGITTGCAPGVFCPDRVMTRAEFATMLVRALRLGPDAPDAFGDDEGHWAEADINRFAAAGLTRGCGSDRFCPDRPLPRDEAAAFFARSLSFLRPLDQAGSAPPADWPPAGEPPPIPAEESD